ncbi:MAG: hypothetical protein PHO01_05345 [Desulfotomaculaceae bacterium]|nr:hypothetical protein [Desulfotomaculaceae bacterium]
MEAFLRGRPTTLTEYDEQLVRRLIEKITFDADSSLWKSSLALR